MEKHVPQETSASPSSPPDYPAKIQQLFKSKPQPLFLYSEIQKKSSIPESVSPTKHPRSSIPEAVSPNQCPGLPSSYQSRRSNLPFGCCHQTVGIVLDTLETNRANNFVEIFCTKFAANFATNFIRSDTGRTLDTSPTTIRKYLSIVNSNISLGLPSVVTSTQKILHQLPAWHHIKN